MLALSHTTTLGFLPISPVAKMTLSGCLAMHRMSSLLPSATSSDSGLSVTCFWVSYTGLYTTPTAAEW